MTVRRILAAVTGTVLISLGLVLLVLPGPGLLLIALGLIVLSLEFEWAGHLVARMRNWLTKRRPDDDQPRQKK